MSEVWSEWGKLISSASSDARPFNWEIKKLQNGMMQGWSYIKPCHKLAVLYFSFSPRSVSRWAGINDISPCLKASLKQSWSTAASDTLQSHSVAEAGRDVCIYQTWPSPCLSRDTQSWVLRPTSRQCLGIPQGGDAAASRQPMLCHLYSTEVLPFVFQFLLPHSGIGHHQMIIYLSI